MPSSCPDRTFEDKVMEIRFLSWIVGPTNSRATEPERFVPATVPGAVQLDWAAAEQWIPPERSRHLNVRYAERGVPILVDYEWMEDKYWLYRTHLDVDPLSPGHRLYFVASVDYRCEIRVGGQVIHAQEGMFTPIKLDLTDQAAPGTILEVLVFPAPKTHQDPVDEKQAMQSCKPAVSYGWDFHPRLIPLGIWDGGHLEVRSGCHVSAADIFYEMNDSFTHADVRLEVTLSEATAGTLKWVLSSPHGATVIEREAAVAGTRCHFFAAVDSPALWWPNGLGNPSLYRSTVELFDETGEQLDNCRSSIGFRRVRLVPHAFSWQDPDNARFPNSRNKPPITLEVNGRVVFAKGSNWVNPDIFPGRTTAERYKPLLTAARDANFNLLRCWGGAPVPKDGFFDLCDELGLMIWQEFPLACGKYEGTAAYLRVLDQESQSIIRRLRSRACLAIWCGGNELFNSWSRMTDQDLALRLLNRNAFDLDPGRPFLMTSPLMGWAHGGYQFRLGDGSEVFQYFSKARNTAYTEFGVPGPAGVDLLQNLLPPKELFPAKPRTHWQHRHAFRAWDASPDSWLELACIEQYFGKPVTLEQLVEWGHWLQCEGLRFVFEEARRQKPVCSMALSWCFNEPWPSAANNSIISWPAEPKPALAAVGKSLRPMLASARVPKFSWTTGEVFTAELFLLNDGPDPIAPGSVEAWLFNSGGFQEQFFSWNHPGAAANTNVAGPTASITLPKLAPGPLRLLLRVPGQSEWESEYNLLARG